MVQDYSREEHRIWEDFRYGLFFGSKEYCNQVKSKYVTTKEPDVEIPQKRLFLSKRGGFRYCLGKGSISDGMQYPCPH